MSPPVALSSILGLTHTRSQALFEGAGFPLVGRPFPARASLTLLRLAMMKQRTPISSPPLRPHSGSRRGGCVTVIIPVYNVTQYLREALHSAATQTVAGVRILVVDDGSSPRAARTIASIVAEYGQARLLRVAHGGAAVARSHGLRAARTRYVLFLDADDILLPDALAYLLEGFERTPEAIASYARLQRCDANGTPLPRVPEPALERLCSGSAVLPTLLEGYCILSNGTTCIRRDALRALPPVNHGLLLAEDWTLWCYLALQGPIVCAGNKVVLHYRRHAHNASLSELEMPETIIAAYDRVFLDPRIQTVIGVERLQEMHEAYIDRVHYNFSSAYAAQGDAKRAALYFQRGCKHPQRAALQRREA